MSPVSAWVPTAHMEDGKEVLDLGFSLGCYGHSGSEPVEDLSLKLYINSIY